MIIWLTLAVALTTAGVRAEGEVAPAGDPPAGFQVDNRIFFAAAAVALAATVGLILVWRQKNDSEQMLQHEQTKLKEAEARWRTQQQNFESKIKKLEDQTSDSRRSQASSPREPSVARKGITRSYQREFESNVDGGQRNQASTATADSVTTAKAGASTSHGSGDGRAALELQRLEEQRQELKSLRDKLAHDQEAYGRRLVDDRKRYEAELNDRYKNDMDAAAAQILQAQKTSASAAEEMMRVADEKQRIDESRKSLADAKARLDEIQKTQDREKAALEQRERKLERMQEDSAAEQRLADWRNAEAQKKQEATQQELDRFQQKMNERDASIKALEDDLQSRCAEAATRQQQLEEQRAENVRRGHEIDVEAERVRKAEAVAQALHLAAEANNKQAESRRRAADELEQKSAREAQEAAQARKAAEAHREFADKDLAEARRARAEIDRVRQSFWPEGFRSGPLAPWQARLEQAVDEGDGDARMLLSFVHVYYAADVATTDTKNIRDALKEISRYLFKYLTRTCDLPECGKQGILWAEELNKSGKGRFSIQLPNVGDPIDANWMIRPSNNAPSVSAVITWAVRDAKGIATHRAEVA